MVIMPSKAFALYTNSMQVAYFVSWSSLNVSMVVASGPFTLDSLATARSVLFLASFAILIFNPGLAWEIVSMPFLAF